MNRDVAKRIIIDEIKKNGFEECFYESDDEYGRKYISLVIETNYFVLDIYEKFSIYRIGMHIRSRSTDFSGINDFASISEEYMRLLTLMSNLRDMKLTWEEKTKYIIHKGGVNEEFKGLLVEAKAKADDNLFPNPNNIYIMAYDDIFNEIFVVARRQLNVVTGSNSDIILKWYSDWEYDTLSLIDVGLTMVGI